VFVQSTVAGKQNGLENGNHINPVLAAKIREENTSTKDKQAQFTVHGPP
jgi:hypothetical protein